MSNMNMLNPVAPNDGNTSNVVDVTDLSDAAFDVYLAAAAHEVVDVGHLTVTEKYWVARALGKDTAAPAIESWCHAN